jgi:hypothetical protein
VHWSSVRIRFQLLAGRELAWRRKIRGKASEMKRLPALKPKNLPVDINQD